MRQSGSPLRGVTIDASVTQAKVDESISDRGQVDRETTQLHHRVACNAVSEDQRTGILEARDSTSPMHHSLAVCPTPGI
jgi:hypothetical protein